MLKLLVIFTLIVSSYCDYWHPHSYRRGKNVMDTTRHFEEDKTFYKNKNSPEVCTKAGCIRGTVESGRKKGYEAFTGVPYAEPPIGNLRFENPVPHRGWSGYWNATYPRDDCLQRNVFLTNKPIVGSEDCLYLNVYRPLERKRKLPGIVYIHGGCFIAFSSKPEYFGPEYLMDTGEVILVTMNYRLGMFGFLCSGDGAVKGNFGLKDQQLALKWVASNIEAFGGDPYSITLAGQSVGAISTQYHMMNPVSQDLFHRAVVISGSIDAFWSFGDDEEENFRLSSKYAGLKNWNTASSLQLANELKKLDAMSLVLALDELFLFDLTPFVPLRPCLEGNWEGAFITENPRKMWSEGRFPHKPIIFGYTADEGGTATIITTNETRLKIFNENIHNLLPPLLDIDPKYVKDVLRFYLGDKDFFDYNNPKPFYQMYGERVYIQPMLTAANQYLHYTDTTKNPIYIYEFGFTGRDTVVKYLSGKDINVGVSHLDDMIYLFTMKDLFLPLKPDTAEGKMSDVFVRYFVNFIVHGKAETYAYTEPCELQSSKPFCDYVVFSRNNKSDLDPVLVKNSNRIDLKMIDFWNKISYD